MKKEKENSRYWFNAWVNAKRILSEVFAREPHETSEFVASMVVNESSDGTPYADVRFYEPICRCVDCEHFDEVIHACYHPNVTKLIDDGGTDHNWILSCFEDDFCCWGVRRSKDGN